MELSNRLQEIASFVPKNTIVGDIGTDHGYIPIYLVEKKIAKRVIATDISKNSLGKIVEYVVSKGYEEDIDTRLGDGLDIIKPFEVDTIVIAGMGGLLIRDILDKNPETRNSITHFILQPNVAAKELREYLYKNNFDIIDEKLVCEEGRFYEIIYAKEGKTYIDRKIYYEIGKKLIENKDQLLEDFINNKIQKSEKILDELKGIDTERVESRCKELVDYIEKLKVVLEEVESN